MQLWWVVDPNHDTCAEGVELWDDKADRFDTTTEEDREDMKLNVAVGKSMVDVPSRGSLAAIQKMKSICAPCS